MIRFFCLIIPVLVAGHSVAAEAVEDFFGIGMISIQAKSGRRTEVVFEDRDLRGKKISAPFLPHMRVSLRTAEQIYSRNLFVRAYFYTRENKLIAVMKSPSRVDRDDGAGMSAMPVFFPGDRKANVYFVLPNEVKMFSHWYALIVFGDKNGAAATLSSRRYARIDELDFPEKELWKNPQKVDRPRVANPLVEHTVKTGINNYPEITLFLRKPIGADDFSDTKGVLAICVLAHTVGDIKRQLQEAEERSGEMSSILNFAEKHQLAILCWGSRSLWDPTANWDEIKRQDQARMNSNFEDVAQAWNKGVLSLARKYGIPTKDFLLTGYSGSAQYAARLALRLPQYFLAVHVHIPSSFDRPTIKANRIMWCLTTGEEEGGYDRSLRFLEECNKLNYPIIYKAIPRLGHAGHPAATRLGLAFFDYALEWREKNTDPELPEEEREGVVTTPKNAFFPASFQTPSFWGDVFRHEVYPDSMPEEERPPALLVPLPSEGIARAWGSAR